ncbi:helix-turn-helix domain-containing protein [Kribbella sp. NPDC050281]|uniref:helix-turn-helix domain-containing protein n=1 Tax=Kribbella sp. NPDC050281 TaxID=3155515 RepID=UPI0033C9CD7B
MRVFTTGSLAAVGINEIAESVYRTLLVQPGCTAVDLCQQLSADTGTIDSALTALARNGLIEKSLDTPTRYLPVAPDLSLEVLIMRAQEELDKVRALTKQLTDNFHRARSPHAPELVEVVTGAAAVERRFDDMQRRAKREVKVLDTPPYAADAGRPNDVELEGLERGVAYRGIYARAALDAGPGVIKAIARYVAAGEEARLINHLPMKLATIDDELGLLPLEVDQDDVSRCFIIRPCSLLDTLLFVFETLWELATPLTFEKGVPLLHDKSANQFSNLDRQILSLLAAGMKDQAIAHHLGLSYSTTRRHIADVSARLGAETRFQAGMQAARLGLGGADSDRQAGVEVPTRRTDRARAGGVGPEV